MRMILNMVLTGLHQFYQNVYYGLWYARSGVIGKNEMIQNPARMRFVDRDLFG